MAERPSSRFRLYWPAWLTLVLGLGCTAWLAQSLSRQAAALDEQQFKLEARTLAQMLETTMERYEERIGRLADHCAQFDELPEAVWYFRRDEVTGFRWQLPAVMHAVYCLKVEATGFKEHAARGQVVWGNQYAFDPEMRPDRKLALPVWQRWSRPEFPAIPLGTDMAEEAAWHPSLSTALGNVPGWISPTPVRTPRADDDFENGFWFALPLFKPEQGSARPWQRPNESEADRLRRHRAFYTSGATGLLAVFISADRMVDQTFNDLDIPHRLHVRLYAGKQPAPESLLNPASQGPAHPRHHELIEMPWYGRRWTLELTSTPQFEADSARSMAWLTLGAGAALTLLAAALVGIALRARNRQELMIDQIREARDALAAALAERQKLSHDLHDNTIQTLYAIQLGLNQTGEKLAAEPAGARRELAAARAELDAVIAGIRRFITAEEGTEQAADLAGVLRALVERARVGTAARIELRFDSDASERLATNQAVQLANIAREALSNSLRHGRARCVDVILRSERDAVCLEIADDGNGFDPNSSARQGVGLTSMTARAKEIGGRFSLDSAPGHGTRVAVRVPTAPRGREGELPIADEPVEA